MCTCFQGRGRCTAWMLAALLLVVRYGCCGNVNIGPTVCIPDPCPIMAMCTEGDGFISCVCPEGKTGTDCTLEDPCFVKTECTGTAVCYGPCDPNVICEGATGYPHCGGCVAGYKSNGTSCLTDVDECTEWTDPPACLNGGNCTNHRGDFTCTCTGGWSGRECSICQEGTVCEVYAESTTTIIATTTTTTTETSDGNDEDRSKATSGAGSWSLITSVTLLSVVVRL